MSSNEPERDTKIVRRETIAAFVSGAIFAVGLAIAGMTQPAKVVGFLDVAGDWDPSLAFVMLGAIAMYASFRRWVMTLDRPVWSQAFSLPTKKDLDGRLVLGAALFGVGWGLGGFCPGPALASLGTATPEVLIFVGAMLVGMFAFNRFERARTRPSERPTDG